MTRKTRIQETDERPSGRSPHKGHSYPGLIVSAGRQPCGISWSFPVFDYPYLKGYVHYFYGSGESLIDYDSKVNRLGIGISVTDWLD